MAVALRMQHRSTNYCLSRWTTEGGRTLASTTASASDAPAANREIRWNPAFG
jgi:hypothetical protein